MKKLMATAAIFVLGAGMAVADPVFGIWKTIPDDNGNFGHIDVRACGSKICGTLIKSFGSDGAEMSSPNTGKKIVWGMEAKGGGEYDGGKVWSPDRDKTYKSKMQLNGNKLAIQGCVMFICRDGGKWTRVK